MDAAKIRAKTIRVAVVGVGDFGRNHVRVLRELPDVDLVGIVDANPARAAAIAQEFSVPILKDLDALAGRVDAATVAVPTIDHARVGSRLLASGIDVLIEKPMAASLAEADQLIATASRHNRILQVGHLERFNPGITAVRKVITRPLFFEVHRLGIFTPRSLDIDVIYDVMIHDLDILLWLVGEPVIDLKAVGIPVVTSKVDIAHARLEFAGGAVANVTASRVSTERVRKLRFFQAHEYLSVDFTRRDAFRVGVPEPGQPPDSRFEKLPAPPVEPLHAELAAFLAAVRARTTPPDTSGNISGVDGPAGRSALELAGRVMAGILEHAARVKLGELVPHISA
jgi:predicted dehydrogenase